MCPKAQDLLIDAMRGTTLFDLGDVQIDWKNDWRAG
jgi:hypothetical protein